MTPTDTDALERLKRAVLNAPKTDAADPTILSISGYPHYENVASNILAFFLDPEEAHHLGTTVLESLLRVVDENPDISKSESIEVRREDQTSEGKRIDIVVSTSDHVIGIENKIRHDLNNPLPVYLERLKTEAAGSRTVVPIVLTTKPETDAKNAKKARFKVAAYKDFVDSLGEALQGQADSANPSKSGYRWFLEQFMEEMKMQSEGGAIREDVRQFFADEEDASNAFWGAAKKMRRELKAKAGALHEQLADSLGQHCIASNIWSDPDCFQVSAWYDFQVGSVRFRIDNWVTPSRWTISVWPGHAQPATTNLDRLLDAAGIRSEPHFQNRFRLRPNSELGYGVDVSEVAEIAAEYAERLCRAASEQS